MEQVIAGIRFVEAGPIVYCSPGDLDLGPGDYVIVRTDQGERLGWVVVAPDQVVSATTEGPVRVIDRLASADDVDAYRDQKRRAEEDISRAQEVATRLDPRMRVASLTYNQQGDRADLTYSARDEGGADRLETALKREFGIPFRVLQVGDRDRAKSLGGLGQCGRALCCSTWMTEFPAISIKMAKDQGLAPNPSKISGVCGRLLCCLSFEVDAYREIIGTLPKVGKRVTTPAGRAKVLSINALTEMVRLRFDEGGEVIEIHADQLRQQYGTAVRPEDLEQQVEGPIHQRDRELKDAFVAAIEPVTERPSPPSSPAEHLDGDGAESPTTSQRSSRRGRRGGRSRRNGGASPGETPAAPAAGSVRASGVRIERRRVRMEISVDAPLIREPAAASDHTTGGDDADADKRRRRRGRRGGRRRRNGSESDPGGATG